MTTLVEPSPTQIYAVLEFVLQTKAMKVMTRKGPGIFCWLNFCEGKCSAWWILMVDPHSGVFEKMQLELQKRSHVAFRRSISASYISAIFWIY